MRIRLSVGRHGLPLAEVLWTVQEDQSSRTATVARLLDQVNLILPLESEDWGLEDYVVEVGGYECLHFSQLGQVMKEDDLVR